MVKVTGGGTSFAAVRAHLQYIGRDGERPIETDDQKRIDSTASANQLLEDWHLDLVSGQYRGVADGRKAKLVYNIVLGMPSPTPANTVLSAAQEFAREKFAATHRYAMVLHTDQKRSHVHLVVKAENESGKRLRIDKATLRGWREDFAQHVRDRGVAANASSRFERGLARPAFKSNEFRTIQAHRSRRSKRWIGNGRTPGKSRPTPTTRVWCAFGSPLKSDGMPSQTFSTPRASPRWLPIRGNSPRSCPLFHLSKSRF